MTTFTCRCCGMTLEAPEGAKTVTCPACATINAVPRVTGAECELLARANRLRMKGEFDRAESAYRLVLMEEPQCHEALWGLLLCRYGVEFVTDPATNGYAPVVHFPCGKPMRVCVEFREACEFAPAEIRAAYEADAARIDELQRKIIDMGKEAPPYDVFICGKVASMDGKGYTEDHHRAFQLYHHLTKKDYRVFYAPAELDGVGVSYDAAIYHALKSAKVMLLVCSSREHLESPWVRSEWTRYLTMMDAGSDKLFVPLLYGDLTADQLPEDILLRGVQALDMTTISAAERLEKILRRM